LFCILIASLRVINNLFNERIDLLFTAGIHIFREIIDILIKIHIDNCCTFDVAVDVAIVV